MSTNSGQDGERLLPDNEVVIVEGMTTGVRMERPQKVVRQLWCGLPDGETVDWEDPVSRLVRQERGALTIHRMCTLGYLGKILV